MAKRRYKKNPTLMIVTNPYERNPIDIQYDSGEYKVIRSNPQKKQKQGSQRKYRQNPRVKQYKPSQAYRKGVKKRPSGAIDFRPKSIGIPERGKYIHYRAKDPKKYDKESFRVKPVPGSRTGSKMVVACPRGKYDAKNQQCRVGTQKQSVMVPKRTAMKKSALPKPRKVAKRKKRARAASNPVSYTPPLWGGNPVPYSAPYYDNTVPLWDNPKRSFEDWMASVNLHIQNMAGGLSYEDLPDQPYYDWYSSGMSPKEAAMEAITESGGGDIFEENPSFYPYDDNPRECMDNPMCAEDNPYGGAGSPAMTAIYDDNPFPYGAPPPAMTAIYNSPISVGDFVRTRKRIMSGDRIEVERGTVGRVERIGKFWGEKTYTIAFPMEGKEFKFKDLFEGDIELLEPERYNQNRLPVAKPVRSNRPKKKKRAKRKKTARKTKGKKKKASKRVKRNPGGGNSVTALQKQPRSQVQPSHVKTKKKKIPVSQFRSWLRKNGSADEKRRFEKEVKAYKRFHKTEPRFVTREVVDVGAGNKLIGRAFGYSMGKSPFEPYITPSGSGKGNKQPYLHEYKAMPEGITNSTGKMVLKPLKKGAKITDWIYG